MDSSYQPATLSHPSTLTTTVHLDKPYSVFVHYQFTLCTDSNEVYSNEVYSKLLVNDNTAGSMIESEKQNHKNVIEFWMANLNAYPLLKYTTIY